MIPTVNSLLVAVAAMGVVLIILVVQSMTGLMHPRHPRLR
jgi:hypothetical protein